MNSDIFWPGTQIAISRNNGFTLGLSDSPTEWADLAHAAALREKSAAHVERRRREGTDNSTFHGLSIKSDRAYQPHGGAYTRVRPKGTTKTERIRAALKEGPMYCLELAALIGTSPAKTRGLLKYDIVQGRIVQLRETKPMRYALAEAE